MNRSKYIQSGIWYIIGNLLIKGISFFTLPLFTRLLGTSDFGNFNLFMSYENIVNVIICLGIAGTVKTAFLDFKDKFADYFSSTISLIIGFAIILDVGVNIFFASVSFSTGGFWDIRTGNLLILCSLATALYNMFSMKYVIELKYKKNLAMSFAYTILSVALSIILCYFFFSESRYMARIIGNTLPLAAMTLSISIFYLSRNRTFYNRDYWHYALKMGVPLIFHSLSLVIMQQADKIMVDSFCGSSINGVYSLACNISIILTIVQSSIDNSWVPWFYTNLDKKNFFELRKKNTYIIILFMYLTCGFIIISPEIIKIAAPVEYQDAVYALIPLNVSVYATFMYMFAVNKEYYHKKTKIIASATIITTLIDIILNYIMIPRFGFISAAYTTLISKVILFIIHWDASDRIDNNKVIETVPLILSFVFVSLISAVCMLTINQIYIRFTILIVISIGIVLVFYKKGILSYLKIGDKK